MKPPRDSEDDIFSHEFLAFLLIIILLAFCSAVAGMLVIEAML